MIPHINERNCKTSQLEDFSKHFIFYTQNKLVKYVRTTELATDRSVDSKGLINLDIK